MNELQTVQSGELSVEEVGQQVRKIQELMKSTMHVDEHYGVIPGCKKPSLYKAGAEKLCFIFRLVPSFSVVMRDLGNNHREYEVVCTITSANGNLLGQGVGLCSTMESKYRYREVPEYDVTDLPIPKDAKERKTEYLKQGYGMKKIDNVWAWVKYKKGEKVEHPDIADTHNTVLKMAKKRSFVDAILTVTAASDIFTQDIEDFPEMVGSREPRNVTPIVSQPITDESGNENHLVNQSVENEIPHENKEAYRACLDKIKASVDFNLITKEQGKAYQKDMNAAVTGDGFGDVVSSILSAIGNAEKKLSEIEEGASKAFGEPEQVPVF